MHGGCNSHEKQSLRHWRYCTGSRAPGPGTAGASYRQDKYDGFYGPLSGFGSFLPPTGRKTGPGCLFSEHRCAKIRPRVTQNATPVALKRTYTKRIIAAASHRRRSSRIFAQPPHVNHRQEIAKEVREAGQKSRLGDLDRLLPCTVRHHGTFHQGVQHGIAQRQPQVSDNYGLAFHPTLGQFTPCYRQWYRWRAAASKATRVCNGGKRRVMRITLDEFCYRHR